MDAPKKKIRPFDSISIRWKLFAILTFFIVFVLCVVWMVQVGLLNNFYSSVRLRELTAFANVMEANINSPELKNIAYDNSADSSICTRILRMNGSLAYEELSVDVNENCVLHHITDDYFNELYTKAKSNDGEYVDRRTLAKLYEEGKYYPRNIFSDKPEEIIAEGRDMVSTILVRIASSASGETYVIMLNADMTPMNTIDRMLLSQFSWICLAMVLGAMVLVFFMAKTITAPIERMTEAAKKLAEGDYSADFSGDGFRETHELADTLNYASRELAKTDKLQKELIANVSHDLRTPLTMITGYGEVMRDIPGENTTENIQVIIDEANRLGELVSGLLDLSRFQAGSLQPREEVFNLTESIREIIVRYSKLTEHLGCVPEFFADEDIFVCADRKMVLQVVYNLMNNAVNYMGADKFVGINQAKSGNTVRISVTDHGEGIAPEQLPLIWDRYYKVDKVHRRASVGTGIGLSIVKGVLEAHGASYGVDSTPGVGSTFWFEMDIHIPQEITE